MATPQKETLRALTAAEQRALERLRRARSERVDRARRATALLAVADGASFAAAARQAGFRSGSAVTALVRRFNRAGLAALDIAAGPRAASRPTTRRRGRGSSPPPSARPTARSMARRRGR